MDNEMLKVLCNIRSLRAAMRELPMEMQEKIQENVLMVVSDNQTAFQIQEEEQKRKEQERQAAIEKVNELLAQNGMTFNDLLPEAGATTSDSPAKAKTKRQPRDPKYRWVQDGEEKTWTGQGKTPKFLAEKLAAGRSLDEFLIQKV
ncbi:H-NS family nucleoid-associated regulatory protein [Aeromonas caviae]|uniref:H-NS family nucleoid-associated regulatory protein n=1 Tax=Aeromonas caviae TaxID=648 RepID=UPI00244CE5E1|nr:H-NS family nucleoid-associated regulatory protein [Aeromonas caviae]MDH1848085.1 H-NS histone family protein [Aeromonas caviae]